ncbi:MAG: hypothetical protein R3359_12960 [Marinirhabdus sp.]|nr:hypothetical protein [Marinirhabdus sp.]
MKKYFIVAQFPPVFNSTFYFFEADNERLAIGYFKQQHKDTLYAAQCYRSKWHYILGCLPLAEYRCLEAEQMAILKSKILPNSLVAVAKRRLYSFSRFPIRISELRTQTPLAPKPKASCPTSSCYEDG